MENTMLDRLAPFVAGLLVLGLVVAGLLKAAAQFQAVLNGLG